MSNSLSLFCPSMGGHEAAVTSWEDSMSKPWPIVVDAATDGDDAGFLTKCDKAWRETDATIIGYLHSDLYILEHGWDQRMLAAFGDPQVAVVGFVGATQLAVSDIYKLPYDYRQLARGDVWSNLVDAGVHGGRDAGTREVAVIDSCAVFVRHEFLARCDGWPVRSYPNSSHCSDLWICCMARRLGRTVRMVGVASSHRSGGRGDTGESWLNQRGGDHQKFHQPAHALIYNDFRDILPLRV